MIPDVEKGHDIRPGQPRQNRGRTALCRLEEDRFPGREGARLPPGPQDQEDAHQQDEAGEEERGAPDRCQQHGDGSAGDHRGQNRKAIPAVPPRRV